MNQPPSPERPQSRLIMVPPGSKLPLPVSETQALHRSLHQDHIADTTRVIVAVARDLFATKGYEGTSIEDILHTSRVSRASIYNRFDSKKDLFRLALEQVETEFIEGMVAEGMPGDDVWEELTNGCIAFLDVATQPSICQIMLVDGPVVLGWDEWNEIEARHGRGLLKGFLQQAMDNGFIATQPTEPLVMLLTGALNEAAMAIAHSKHPAKTRRELTDAFRWMFDSLRIANRTLSGSRQMA